MTGRMYYTTFMFLALGVFLIARHFIPRPTGLVTLPWWKRLALGLAAFIGGVLGAKLPFAAGSSAGFLTADAWLGDGKTVVAGMIGAYVLVELTKLALEIRVKTGDTFALPLALSMAVGRWGCFFNGCCYGVSTELPWGVNFDVAGSATKCHPTQIYESLFHLAMAVVLMELLWRGLWRRHHLQIYLIAYGAYRFLTEFIRPEAVWWLGLTYYQWLAVVLVVGLTVQWIVEAWLERRERVARGPLSPRYSGGRGPG
jgi:phosphatidylglycerol---prolipoprotein diacylglyceryl transferase